jgi:hypothetical protein
MGKEAETVYKENESVIDSLFVLYCNQRTMFTQIIYKTIHYIRRDSRLQYCREIFNQQLTHISSSPNISRAYLES